MLTKTLSEAKKKQRISLIKAMNNDIGSIDSSKDSWNPAQISERAKDISYIRTLVDTWNPAQLNEALKMLDLPVIDTWNPAQIEEQRRNLVFYLTERTLTGNPITLKILGNLTPEVTGLKVTMNPIQSGTGDPSPTNVRPISGRTEASVTRTGVNQWDEEWEQGAYNSSGEKVVWNGAIRSKNTISVFPNSQYYIKFSGTTTLYICWYRGNSFIERVSISPSGVVTPPTNATKMTICTHNDYGTTYNNNISVNYPSTDTEYHAYTAETKTHQYSETIYGGVDDFVNGGATSTYGMVDLGSLTYTRTNTGDVYYFYAPIADMKIPETVDERKTGIISDIYTPARNTGTAGNMLDGEMLRINGRIYLRNDAYLTTADLKSAMTGHQLCYELATPTTISTSAEEITLLKGTDVLSTDGDSIELKYKQNF